MNTPDTEGGEKESNLIEHNGNYYVRCETHEEVIRRLQEKHEEAISSRDTYWMERVRKEFGEFAHEHYLGCHTDEVGKWHYSYDNEVVYLVDAYLEKITNEG